MNKQQVATIKVFSNSRRYVEKIHDLMYGWKTSFGAEVGGIHTVNGRHYFYAEADYFLLNHWSQENIEKGNYEIDKQR